MMPRLWTRIVFGRHVTLAKSAGCGFVQLPAAILEIVLDTPSSALGLTYRRYIKTAFLPGIRRVAELLRAHSATIEVSDTGLLCRMHLRLLFELMHSPKLCSVCRLWFCTVAAVGLAARKAPEEKQRRLDRCARLVLARPHALLGHSAGCVGRR